MPQDRQRLPDADFERIYSFRIRPDLLDGLERAKAPAAVLVLGLSDMGSAYMLARIRANLAQSAGVSAEVSIEQLREYHPYWRANASLDPKAAAAVQPDIHQWHSRLLTDATARKVNLVLEVDPHDAASVVSLARRLRREGYQVATAALAIERDLAPQIALARYDLAREMGLAMPPPAPDQDGAFDALRRSLAKVEKELAADRIQLVAPDGRQLYANEMAGDHWVAEPRSEYVLNDYSERRRTARELADDVLRWQALAQRFASDATAPRALTAHIEARREEALQEAGGDPEATRLIAFGHEADAFRQMNRPDFVRTYPQHAKAVERLQEAIDYAEKQFEHAADRERFVEQARNRLADRIAEGRSFAAGRSKSRPAEHEPRTR